MLLILASFPPILTAASSNDMVNVTDTVDELLCEELPTWSSFLGVVMGIFGSIGINVGQNMQASGLAALPEEQMTTPHKSTLWIYGMGIFVSFSMLNFAALALAPASVLTCVQPHARGHAPCGADI